MQNILLKWYDENKRDLPWRRTRDPYAIWVSEIMLQQTRAETVAGYWTRFLEAFPTLAVLASAPEEAVLKAWEGLGYYSRARNLRRCAQVVLENHGGAFPRDVQQLKKLPGIGDYTAGAVGSIAFGLCVPAVDGNVERVISRLRGIREDVGIPSVRRQLRQEAAALVPEERAGDFNQAMMELGARVCLGVPRCAQCPLSAFCDACAVGDADALPCKQRKAAQRIVPRGIAIVRHAGRVLVRRRDERLLHGLWEFPGFDGANVPEQVEKKLREIGVSASFVGNAGEARHVFTHLIWEMTLLRFDAASAECPAGWLWADAAELAALPLPTALKAARAQALALLSPDAH